MRNKIIIQKMLGYVSKVIRYCEDYSYEQFSEDSMLVEACVFNLSQLGELCHTADDAFVQNYPRIPWKEMYGLRNRIVHDYEGVNLRLVWEIIRGDLPELEEMLRKLFEEI